MCGDVVAGAGDDLRPLADDTADDADEFDLLVVGRRRRFAGGAGDDEHVVAELDEVVRHLLHGRIVDAAVALEWSHHCSADGTERVNGSRCCLVTENRHRTRIAPTSSHECSGPPALRVSFASPAVPVRSR